MSNLDKLVREAEELVAPTGMHVGRPMPIPQSTARRLLAVVKAMRKECEHTLAIDGYFTPEAEQVAKATATLVLASGDAAAGGGSDGE